MLAPMPSLHSLSPELVDGKWTYSPPKLEPTALDRANAKKDIAIAKCQYWCSTQASKFTTDAAKAALCEKAECNGCDFCAAFQPAVPVDAAGHLTTSTTSSAVPAAVPAAVPVATPEPSVEIGKEPRLLIAHGCSQSTVVGHIFFHIAKAMGMNFLGTRCKKDVTVSGCGGGRDEEGLKHEKNAFCGATSCDWPAAINATVAEVVHQGATLFLQGGPVHVHMEDHKPMWYKSMGDWDPQIAQALLRLNAIPAGVLRCNQLDKAICEVRDGFYTDFGLHGLGMSVGWKVKYDTGEKVEHVTGGDISIRDEDKSHQDKAFVNASAIKQYLTTYSEENLKEGIKAVFKEQGYDDDITIECAEDLLKFTQSDSVEDMATSQNAWHRLLEGWKLPVPETKLAELLSSMEDSPGKKYRNSFALRDTGDVIYNSEEVVNALGEIDRLDLWRGPASKPIDGIAPSPSAGTSRAEYMLNKHRTMKKQAELAAMRAGRRP
jgi:hypothetical protein